MCFLQPSEQYFSYSTISFSTDLWKSRVEAISKEEIPLKHFPLRRCTLIRIGRNDEKNQHLQEKWTLS